jgi:hypothetical protein
VNFDIAGRGPGGRRRRRRRGRCISQISRMRILRLPSR